MASYPQSSNARSLIDEDDDDDDDDEMNAFSFLKPGFKVDLDDDFDIDDYLHRECVDNDCRDFTCSCKLIEKAWIERDVILLSELSCTLNNQDELDCLHYVNLILNGSHVCIFSGNSGRKDACCDIISSLIGSCTSLSQIRLQINSLFKRGRPCIALKLLILGSALLDIYVQANYCGPELFPKDFNAILGTSDETKHELTFQHAIQLLECDGEYPFPLCTLPQVLYVSRCILTLAAEPTRGLWKNGILLGRDGEVLKSSTTSEALRSLHPPVAMIEACSQLSSASWSCARSCVIHLRLLQSQSHERTPTLWKECCDFFRESLSRFAPQMSKFTSLSEVRAYLDSVTATAFPVAAAMSARAEPSLSVDPAPAAAKRAKDRGDGVAILAPVADGGKYSASMLECQLWLEWGLAWHFFGYKDKVATVILNIIVQSISY